MTADNPTSATTEAHAVAELARESRRYGQTIQPSPFELHVNVVPDDANIEAASYEAYQHQPQRPRGTSTVTSAQSFLRLLRQPRHHGSVIFADDQRARVTAVVNFEGWRDHRIVLQLQHSEPWTRWTDNHDKLMGQTDFAELIEAGVPDIVDPAAADMLELAQTFEATKEVQFESGARLSSGAVRFRYLETVTAKAGRAADIEVPATFMLYIPIWRGGDRVALNAALRYRIAANGLRLGYKLIGLHDVIDTEFGNLTDQIETSLDADAGHLVVTGPAPAAIDPMP
ncbi:YfdQ family protein [Nocardia sp. CDC159]|uniref:YfdQ family protein n=1 Tax=Nocardia pulmonis TaxID=2951408 RepID=A0A9X2EG89_9NOCA|nr:MULTISPECIES: DUF2303 family protein [Nocardia]MCM6777736.1 YfdQ family protein [Nocardia pulmonis]MCM6790621.1 YfdQ family protein [Nocardia sp. CDC159]